MFYIHSLIINIIVIVYYLIPEGRKRKDIPYSAEAIWFCRNIQLTFSLCCFSEVGNRRQLHKEDILDYL